MMKVLLTGGKGMLGRTIRRILGGHFEIIPTDLPEADITDPGVFSAVLAKHSPDAVIHCAAMTAVDKCETERELAYRLNERGSANVATACKAVGCRLLAISTDYVFDGFADHAYTEYDTANGGATLYGKSKFAGEEAIRRIYPENSVICRVSWLYGFGGPSFVHTMLQLADGSRPVLKVVSDQIGNPTSAVAVSRKLGELLERPEVTGTIHMTCEGEASWADFAREIFRRKGVKQEVLNCTTEEFPRPAPRPKNSRLVKQRLRELGFAPMPDWKDALSEFLKLEFK